MVCRAALNRQSDDVAGLLFAFFLGLGLDVPDHGGGVMIGVLLHAVNDVLPRFVLRHGGDALQLADLLGLEGFRLGFQSGHVVLPLLQLLFLLVQAVHLLVQLLFALLRAVLRALNVRPAGVDFLVQLGLLAKYFFLGFQDHFLFLFIRLAGGVIQKLFGIFFRPADLAFDHALVVAIARKSADQQSGQGNDCRNQPIQTDCLLSLFFSSSVRLRYQAPAYKKTVWLPYGELSDLIPPSVKCPSLKMDMPIHGQDAEAVIRNVLTHRILREPLYETADADSTELERLYQIKQSSRTIKPAGCRTQSF